MPRLLGLKEGTKPFVTKRQQGSIYRRIGLVN